MIIDLILDRKDGCVYNPRQFYNQVVMYGEVGNEIAQALDSGENQDVVTAISRYIINNEYSPEIIKYVQSVKWLE